jgi:hypothetical protein
LYDVDRRSGMAGAAVGVALVRPSE